jgi:hypothetical protein
MRSLSLTGPPTWNLLHVRDTSGRAELVRVRVLALLSVVLLLAASCSGGEGEERPASPFRAVNRPIVDIVPASDIGEGGQPVDPGFAFDPAAPQITVVAQVGEVTGSPMDLTWYRVTDEGEEELFTHTVGVASFEAAYSVGESPGALAFGRYRVEATLEGESRSTQFEVVAPEGATDQSATSGPPASGDSGAVATPVSGLPEGSGVSIHVLQSPIDYGPPMIEVGVSAYLPGGGGTLQAKATMAGNTRTVSYPVTGAGVEKWLDFYPCAHPGGSDLPGTKATFESALYVGDTFEASETQFTTLGPDTTKPGITINSEPPAGSQVEPGDEILLDATAQENRNGPSWQTGLHTFQLTATPGGQVGEPQQAGSPLPQACDRKQWSLSTQGTYEVPADAPPVIEICGIAEDFAGNVQTKCNEYYAGEVWEGEVTGEAVQAQCSPPSVPLSGGIRLVVAPDGTVTGTVTEARDGFTCAGTPVPAFEGNYTITGTKTATAFELTATGTGSRTVTMPIEGDRATVTIDEENGGYGATVIYTVRCVTCGGTG